jgi:small conductance mechanosensitive channel
MLSDLVKTYVIPIALHVLLAVVVWIIGRWLARRSQVWLTQSLQKTALTESIISLTKTIVYYGIMIFTGAVALAALGVPVTVIAATLGIVVVVLAIALQASIANLAATVIFLLFKPFKPGDIIETAGEWGVVDEIQILSTVLNASDGKTHILPNGKIQAAGLTNYSTKGMLRIDLNFRISYDGDVEKAKAIVTNLLAAEPRVLAQPPAQVFVQQLADSSVELVAWPFTKVEDYAPLKTELVERVKTELDAAGIVIPYPQQNVHLYTHS